MNLRQKTNPRKGQTENRDSSLYDLCGHVLWLWPLMALQVPHNFGRPSIRSATLRGANHKYDLLKNTARRTKRNTQEITEDLLQKLIIFFR